MSGAELHRVKFYATPEHSIRELGGMLVMCHGNFLPVDSTGRRVYIGDIFTEAPAELERRLRRLGFEAVKRDGMAIYALRTIASVKPGDIIVTKIGDNTIEVYEAGEYRVYIAFHPPEKYLEEHRMVRRGKEFVETYEQYCIEVKKLGTLRVDENLYKKLAVPRAITEFKNKELVRALMQKIQQLLASVDEQRLSL